MTEAGGKRRRPFCLWYEVNRTNNWAKIATHQIRPG